MAKRKSFTSADKNWWIEEYAASHFRSKRKFLDHLQRQKDMRGGDWYEKVKKRDVPGISTFSNWHQETIKAKIKSNPKSKKKKERSCGHPELETLVLQYIENLEELLSKFGLGISWEVVRTRTKKLADDLLQTGVMSAEDHNRFKCSNGWLAALQRRNNLKCVKEANEHNSLVSKVGC